MSAWLVPLAPHLHQLVAQDVFVLLGFVRVQLPIRLWIRFGVGVGWVGHERVRRVGRGLWPAVHRGNHSSSLVAVDAEAALARHLDESRGRTGRGRQGHVAGAKGHTAHCSIYADALVLATSLEILPILINPSIVFTGATLCLC